MAVEQKEEPHVAVESKEETYMAVEPKVAVTPVYGEVEGQSNK